MRPGKIVNWNDERGFGFIGPAAKATDNSKPTQVFMHISALSDQRQRPQLGDDVLYQLGQDAQGRPRAIRVVYPRASAPSRSSRKTEPTTASLLSRTLFLVLGILLLLAAGISLYRYLTPAHLVPASPEATAAAMAAYLNEVPQRDAGSGGEATGTTPAWQSSSVAGPSAPPEKFDCQGKNHCTQMTSCAEAQFTLTHCPWPQMDGDGDGIPCEDQWCGH